MHIDVEVSSTNVNDDGSSEVLESEKSENFSRSSVSTNKILATHIVAWNNDDTMVDILKHIFKHRSFEASLDFDLRELLRNGRANYAEPATHEAESQRFLESCSRGEDYDVYELLASDVVDVNVADARGNTAIIFASACDQTTTLNTILDAGANVNQLNDEGFTPLTLCLARYLCVQHRAATFEQALLPPRSQQESDSQDVATQWHERVSDIDLLFFTELDDNEATNEYKKQLRAAKSHAQKAAILPPKMKYIFSINPVLGVPPIVKKSKKMEKSKKLKKVLAEEGDKNALSAEEQEELSKIEATIQLLLSRGANPNTGAMPMTALVMSLFTRQVSLVQDLLNHGADPNVIALGYVGDLTPLHILARMPPCKEQAEMAQALIDSGANCSARTSPDFDAETKLFLLNACERTEEGDDDDGMTPLQLLVARTDASLDTDKHLCELAKVLGANMDPYSVLLYMGHTALSIAILRGNVTLVTELLASNTVDPHEPVYQLSPLALLMSAKCFDNLSLPDAISICDLLIQYGADPWAVFSIDSTSKLVNTIEFSTLEATKVKPPPRRKEYKRLAAHLLSKAKSLLYRHIQAQITRKMCAQEDSSTLDGTPRHQALDKLYASYLTTEDVNRCCNLLHLNLPSGFAYTPSTTLNGQELIESPFITQPETDEDISKFEVCFECGKRGKDMKVCPICNEVRFCSSECKKKESKRKGHETHNCGMPSRMRRKDDKGDKKSKESKKKSGRTKGEGSGYDSDEVSTSSKGKPRRKGDKGESSEDDNGSSRGRDRKSRWKDGSDDAGSHGSSRTSKRSKEGSRKKKGGSDDSSDSKERSRSRKDKLNKRGHGENANGEKKKKKGRNLDEGEEGRKTRSMDKAGQRGKSKSNEQGDKKRKKVDEYGKEKGKSRKGKGGESTSKDREREGSKKGRKGRKGDESDEDEGRGHRSKGRQNDKSKGDKTGKRGRKGDNSDEDRGRGRKGEAGHKDASKDRETTGKNLPRFGFKSYGETSRGSLFKVGTGQPVDFDKMLLPYVVLKDGQLYYRLWLPRPTFTGNYSLV